MSDNTDLILTEIRGLRENVNEGFRAHAERLARIEAHVETIFGDGETGRLPHLESKVEGITNKIYFFSGLGAAISTAVHWIFPRK